MVVFHLARMMDFETAHAAGDSAVPKEFFGSTVPCGVGSLKMSKSMAGCTIINSSISSCTLRSCTYRTHQI